MTIAAVADERPPFVSFEVQAIEDRDASNKAGHFVGKNVIYVYITPKGSKDRHISVAEEWLVKLKAQVAQGRFKQEWYDGYCRAYEAFKSGQQPVLDGTDIRNWRVASPAQIKTLVDINIRTIEDMAQANEETIARLGMGGRALKEKAREWLAAADQGKQTEAMDVLRAENENLKVRNETLEAQVASLAARLDALEGPSTAKVAKQA